MNARAPGRGALPGFTRFAVADWSGAKGHRHRGIALALCDEGRDAPRLIRPATGLWSRTAIAEWVEQQADTPMLIGFDFSFAPPIIARGDYLPGDSTPRTAKAFWAYVNLRCDDDDLGAASFLEVTHRRHFYFGAADGPKAAYMHNRLCETAHLQSGGSKPATIYDAIGAAQVAKASFAGMRLLHRIAGTLPVWPFDPVPMRGAMLIEIYAAIAARAAGMAPGRTKIRTPEMLNQALARLGSQPVQLSTVDEHQADAILTAAWLRRAAAVPANWHPSGLSRHVARTEGWTFGVV